MDASSVEGEMEIIRGSELIDESHVEEWSHVELSIRPLIRSELRVPTNFDKLDDNDDDDAMINVSPIIRAYEQAYSSRTNQEKASSDQGSACLFMTDSDNGRRVRLFGVNLREDEAVTTDPPHVPGSEPSVPIDAEDSDDEEDDEEVIVLSRTAFEEVLRSGRAESRSAANNPGSGESSASNQQRIPDDNMQLEGRPGPSMVQM